MTTIIVRSSGPLPCLLGVLALPLALGGCPSPDAQGKYDRFNEETEDDRERPEPKMDMGGPPMLPDFGGGTGDDTDGTIPFDGVFLLAIDTSVNPGTPLQFLAQVTAELDMTFSGTMSVEFQPLSLDVGSTTEPREEVGDALTIDTEVTNAAFSLPFGETMVTGLANPITGSDILADIALEGTIQGLDGFCGTASGEVLSPVMLPLEGSTFGGMRLTDRDERPLEFPVDCAGNTYPPT
jgi:hypothetical protein